MINMDAEKKKNDSHEKVILMSISSDLHYKNVVRYDIANSLRHRCFNGQTKWSLIDERKARKGCSDHHKFAVREENYLWFWNNVT